MFIQGMFYIFDLNQEINNNDNNDSDVILDSILESIEYITDCLVGYWTSDV